MMNNRKHCNFFINKKFSSMRHGRASHYVMIPGCPRFPTMHPGVDDTVNNDRDMSHDHQELLKMGEATIATLINSGNKACPTVLFLAMNEHDVEYRPHLLSTYIPTILQERQYKFILHIAGHGDREKIGSIDPEQRIMIEDFAAMLAALFENLDRNKAIYIEFHTCNSAYCDINNTMHDEQIKQIIRNETLIGKFLQAMRNEGFHNITVTGYRGYYSHLASHHGSVVTNDLVNPTTTIIADKAAITIQSDNNVILPQNRNALHFQVHLLRPVERRAHAP